eukprot:TRINITY_DN623_c0_g1_i2.p1 TRINITY_DN623_c0_g1~~TRINITY_DN623_c0_g1_i2.p1  ORF type:complete len:214 (-),score=42.46 TRINITY_DN623_c0_g1_i2:69-710(-)
MSSEPPLPEFFHIPPELENLSLKWWHYAALGAGAFSFCVFVGWLRGGGKGSNNVVYPQKDTEIQHYLQLSASKLVVIEFFAFDNPLNEDVQPLVEQIGAEFTDTVLIVRCDLEKFAMLAQQLKIQMYHTFLFFRNGKNVDKIAGPDGLDRQLRFLIKKHTEGLNEKSSTKKPEKTENKPDKAEKKSDTPGGVGMRKTRDLTKSASGQIEHRHG